jgi:hypothetical protein
MQVLRFFQKDKALVAFCGRSLGISVEEKRVAGPAAQLLAGQSSSRKPSNLFTLPSEFGIQSVTCQQCLQQGNQRETTWRQGRQQGGQRETTAPARGRERETEGPFERETEGGTGRQGDAKFDTRIRAERAYKGNPLHFVWRIHVCLGNGVLLQQISVLLRHWVAPRRNSQLISG